MKTLIIFLCLAGGCCAQYDLVYPRWFLFPDTLHASAAGYVYDDSNSASLDGMRRYWGHRQVRVFGERRYYQSEAGTDFQDSIRLSAVLDRGDSLRIIAVYMLDHDSLVLTGPVDFEADAHIVRAKDLPRPDWVTHLPTRKGYVFGVGRQDFKRGLHHRSWSLSDEDAIVSCARSVQVRLRNLLKSAEADRRSVVENVVSEQLDVELRDIRVAGRWLDVKAGTCFTLVRAEVAFSIEKEQLEQELLRKMEGL